MGMIPVEINGERTELDDATLIKSEGSIENDNEITRWVEYRQTPDGPIVHRSVHVHLKHGLFVDGSVEGF